MTASITFLGGVGTVTVAPGLQQGEQAEQPRRGVQHSLILTDN